MAKIVEYILDIKSGKATKGLKKMGESAGRAAKKLGRVKKSGLQMAAQVGTAVTSLSAGVGLAAMAFGTMFRAIKDLAKGAKDLTKEVVDSVNNLNDLSAISGLSAQTIQALAASFEASGQESSKAQGFVGKWPKIYSDLATEGSKAAVAAKQLGIEVKNSDGSMKSSDELLINITKSLQAVGDDTQRATAGFAILGRAGADFLQALGKTAEFAAFHDLTEKFGVKTGPKASAEAAEFQVTLAAVQVVVSGLKQDFINATDGVKLFTGFLRQTIVVSVALQEMIAANQDSFKIFGEGIALLASGIFDFFQSTLGAFGEMLSAFATDFAKVYLALSIIAFELGVITEESLVAVVKQAAGLIKVAEAGTKITTELSSMEFGKSKGSAEALASLDAILAGLDKSIGVTEFSFKELDAQLKATGKAAVTTGKMIRTAEEKDYDKRLASIDAFISSTQDSFDTLHMDPLERQLHSLDQTFSELESAFKFLDESGMSTIQVEQLLAKTREEQVRIMLEGVDATKIANIELENLFGGFATGIDAVQSPEQFLRSLPEAMKAAPAIAQTLGAGTRGLAAAGSLAAAAPVVGALGMVAVALAKLGESTEAEINEKFDSFMVNFEKGIDLLPKLIMNVLPEFIAQIAKVLFIDLTKLIAIDLPIAILASIPILIVEIVQEVILLIADIYKGIVRTVEGITNFIDRLKTDGIRGIIDAFKEAFKELMTDMKDWVIEAFAMRSGGRFIPQAAGGIRFTGADQGLALLHRGETVVPESNVTSQAVNRRMNSSMGGGLNIIINADIIEGNAVDALVRKIEERFGEFGASTSTLFGGT